MALTTKVLSNDTVLVFTCKHNFFKNIPLDLVITNLRNDTLQNKKT